MHIVEQAPDTLNNTDESQRSSPKWEKPDTRAYLTHDSIQIKWSRYFCFFLKKADQQLPAASAERGNGSQRGEKHLCRVAATLCVLAAVRASGV